MRLWCRGLPTGWKAQQVSFLKTRWDSHLPERHLLLLPPNRIPSLAPPTCSSPLLLFVINIISNHPTGQVNHYLRPSPDQSQWVLSLLLLLAFDGSFSFLPFPTPITKFSWFYLLTPCGVHVLPLHCTTVLQTPIVSCWDLWAASLPAFSVLVCRPPSHPFSTQLPEWTS